MTDPKPEPRKSAEKPRGRPFLPGNAGKPKGTRHKATLAAEKLLDGEAEGLTRKAVELALAGDTTALRLCLERILPPRKDRPVSVAIGDLARPADALKAVGAIMTAVAAGELTPSEASGLATVVETFRRTAETVDLAERIAALEAAQGEKR